ncbi:MAG: GAF domain-containing protein [Thermodesulfobacteriota bacterium]
MLHQLFNELSGPWLDACLLVSRKGVIRAGNPAASTMLGIPLPELAGRDLLALACDPPEQVLVYLSTCAKNRQQIPGALSFRGGNGEATRYSSFGYLIRTPEEPLIFLRCSRAKTANNRFVALNQQLEKDRATQHRLMAANARLSTVFDSLESVIYVADMVTHEVLFINRTCRETLGEITGKICWQAVQHGQNGPCSFCTNHLLLQPDGSPAPPHVWEFRNTVTGRWFHIVDRAIPWDDGRLVRLEIATDITTSKEAEEHLRLDEERYKSLLALSSQHWNTREKLVEFALDEAVRLTGSEVGYMLFLNQDQQTIEFIVWSRDVAKDCAISKNIHYPLEKAGIWGDAVRERRPVIHNDYPSTPHRKGYLEGHFPLRRHMSVPVMDDERIVAVCGVCNKESPYNDSDARQLALYMQSMWAILRRKQDELAIRHAKEEWERTFDAIDEVVTIHDREMTIVRANRAAGNLFGVEPGMLVGRKCHEVFRGEPSACPDCPEVLSVKTRQTEHGEIHHQNIKRLFDVSSCPIIDQQGELTGFVHIAKDITEKSSLQEQLRQAQKMEAVGTLAGGIAHDFNNILTPILGFTELALERCEPASPLASDLSQVLQAARRAKDLVKQILSFSRQSTQERKPLQLHLVLKEALKLLRASLPSSIEIRQQIVSANDTVLADPTQIHQVLMNLCTNAHHAMRGLSSGVLGVELARIILDESDAKTTVLGLTPGPYLQLSVSDTGCGMDHATMEKIFEPYFTTKAKGEGTGLGLAVVHGIMQGYGGHISVYSEPGKGTTFNLYFPAMEAVRPTLGQGLLKEGLPQGNNERIMVVDDEAPIVEMHSRVLSSLGYAVTGFSNCEEAMKAIRTRLDDFDLIITDMTMPRLNGIDLSREIQAIRPGMPVILCTGFSELINEENAREHGIRKYLGKPVAVREMAMAVRQALDEK